MNLNQPNNSLGPEDWTMEHPEYYNVTDAFWEAFDPLVSEPLPEDFTLNNADFANDNLVAIDQIITELYGTEEAKRNVIKNDDDYIASHPYTVQIAQAKAIALENLKKPVATKKVASPALPTPPLAIGNSAYPPLPMDLTEVTHDFLVAELTRIAGRYREKKDYLSVREDFVLVSLALNQFGLLAPVFRDQPRILPKFKKGDVALDQLLIDQIVIDCHWLRLSGEPVSVVWPELTHIFDPSVLFDCSDIAKRIAAKGWSSDFRVNDLFVLTTRQQLQLMQLRNKDLKEKYRVLVDGKHFYDFSISKPDRVTSLISPVRRAIVNWVDNNHRVRGQEKMYVALWLARELLGNKASFTHLAELAALRCGVKPLSSKTVSEKFKQLDKVLAESGIVGASVGV